MLDNALAPSYGVGMKTPALVEFHIPTRPYTPIDAHNRAAAAHGSPRYAQLTSHADYNGHHVTLSWNDYRQYYVAEYFWAGRVVIGRGDFASCLDAVLCEHARGALGASATIMVKADDQEALDLVRGKPEICAGSIWGDAPGGMRELSNGSWWTWRHDVGRESARDMANPRCPVLIFDWDLCLSVESRAAYETSLRTKYGRVYQ